jgi:hypothetical protein
MERDQIIAAYRQLLKRSPKKPPGMNALLQALPGLSMHVFRGTIWRSWRSFQEEIGVEPNSKQARLPDEQVLAGLASLARKLQRIPTDADLRFERKKNPEVPSLGSVRHRAKNFESRAKLLADFCSSHTEFADVWQLLGKSANGADPAQQGPTARPVLGYVYLQKAGRRYKIGKTSAPHRRLGEVQLLMPDQITLLHTIETDDPSGIEAYWKKRFEAKHHRGEWYDLTADDVAAFRRWKAQ